MKKRNLVLVTTIGLLLAGGSLVATTSANASDDSSPFGGLVEKIALEFNLNQDEVQKVFDEDRQERHAERQQELEDRLSQAVTDGKITDVQKTAILNKLEEMETNKPDFGDFKDKTVEERDQAMEQRKTELENWAEENGLTIETLDEVIGRGGFGMGMKGGMRGMHK